jgi:hypothetical protein
MGYSLNTKRVYRSQAKRLSKAYDKMPDDDVRKPKVLQMVLTLKEKIGLDWTEQEFNDFWNAKPGRPVEVGGNAEDIIREMNTRSNNAMLTVEERMKLFRSKERARQGLPPEEEATLEQSDAMLKEMMEKYPVNPDKETNRGHEDKDREPEATYYFSWVTWAD